MRVVIIEDEIPAATRLARMLQGIDADIEIIASLDSVESSVKYLQSTPTPDIALIFMDIQLADGLSFGIFQQVKVAIPVIFTTAFDQYTLKAFKVNSLDYLLKPIDQAELEQAVEKYRELYQGAGKGALADKETTAGELSEKFEKLVQEMSAAKYKERLLIKRGQQFHYLRTDATAYYCADGKLCYAIDFKGQSHLLDNNLNQLEGMLAPRQFYRVNRQLLVNIESIRKIHTWLGGRLKLELEPRTDADTIVSRERVNGFKEWLGQ
jgi:two-component system LytT family response regulator